jgi:hypothetical protein
MITLRDGFKAVLRDKLTKISEKLIKISQETTTRILKINQRYYKTLMERSSLNIILRYPNGISSFDDK